MTSYRVLRTLDMGKKGQVKAGDLLTSQALSPEALNKLIAVGAIGELHAPPLDELPGLEQAVEQLALIGITTADQFLECDIDVTAERLQLSGEILRVWRKMVLGWLVYFDE